MSKNIIENVLMMDVNMFFMIRYINNNTNEIATQNCI